MEKKIEDYLHLYLGCECMMDGSWYTLRGVDSKEEDGLPALLHNDHSGHESVEYDEVKLILRPLSDMTKEESLILNVAYDVVKEWAKTAQRERWTQDEFIYLLKYGFDLFGLIEAGLAIDKTKFTK